YYFYPAIAIGDAASTTPPISVFLSYTWPAVSAYASGAVRTYKSPPVDTGGPFPTTASGLAPYVALDTNNRNRWGDYSGAVYDWSRESIWGAIEYAGTSNTWRTRISEVELPFFSDGFESGDTSAWSSAVP
ncbi:MAG: hypothetical protein V3T72_03640, partial [Thermoanaerobaculia bacterium]